jgi:hypothetical protein
MTIKIKAPYIILIDDLQSPHKIRARAISESTYRRLLALVRACEKLQGTSTNMFALYAPLAELHAQCEKENKRG